MMYFQMTYQNWGWEAIAKAAIRGKCVTVSTYSRKKASSQLAKYQVSTLRRYRKMSEMNPKQIKGKKGTSEQKSMASKIKKFNQTKS